MTIAIRCECGGEAVFWLDGTDEYVTKPTANCEECGQLYRMNVEKVVE